MAASPWAGMPGERPFRGVIYQALTPQADLRVQSAQARLDGRPFPPGGLSLARERWGIYAVELGGTAAALAGFLAVGLTLARRPRALACGLGLLALVDLTYQGRARPFDLGPIRPLVDQSPVLRRVADHPRGFRTLDPAQNLFQVVGGAPATAYRTLDLPSPRPWLDRARRVDRAAGPEVAALLRAMGVGARVLDPFELRQAGPGWDAGGWGRPAATVRDPALAGWLFGADFARINRVQDFGWVIAAAEPARAWRLGAREAEAGRRIDPDPSAFEHATPLPLASPDGPAWSRSPGRSGRPIGTPSRSSRRPSTPNGRRPGWGRRASRDRAASRRGSAAGRSPRRQG